MPNVRTVKLYDPNDVLTVVDKNSIKGFADDGMLEYDRDADLGSLKVGVLGHVIYTRSNNNLVFVNMFMNEGTRDYRLLGQSMKNQRRTRGRIRQINYLMLDLVNGDRIADRNAVFIQAPLLTKALESTTRVFRLALPNGKANSNIDFGSLNNEL